jgi:predicted GNAT superfamily acetyltransferase
MDLAYELQQPPLSAQDLEELLDLTVEVFGIKDPVWVPDARWRIQNMPDFTCFTARAGAELVGFKLGYAYTRRRYYSWLGGVHPEYRGQGIARFLMNHQHQWLVHRSYSSVETGASDNNEAMIQLNLDHSTSIMVLSKSGRA